MSTLSFDRVSHGELCAVSAVFSPGTHVVLGRERDGTSTLVPLAAGLLAPSSGRVALDGHPPGASARERRSIASLCDTESLPPARSVHASLSWALAARGDDRAASSLLERAGLSSLSTRSIRGLSTREVRALALAFALSHRAPALVALHEPLALCELLSAEFVLEAIAAFAASGAIVLVTTSRVEDVARFDAVTHALERGVWIEAAKDRYFAPTATLRLASLDRDRLAGGLAAAPGVEAVAPLGDRELLVRGADAARVVSRARELSIAVSALRPAPASLDAPLAARAGLAHAFASDPPLRPPSAHPASNSATATSVAGTFAAPAMPEHEHETGNGYGTSNVNGNASPRDASMNGVLIGAQLAAARLNNPTAVLVIALCAIGVLSVGVLERRSDVSAAPDATLAIVFGLVLPLLAYLTSERACSAQPLARSVEGVARYGADRRAAVLGVLLGSALATSLAGALLGALGVLAAHASGDPALGFDLQASAGIGLLVGGVYALWFGAASLIGQRGAGRRWALIADFALGSTSSVIAAPFPRGHARNLLGGEPLLDISQAHACLALAAIALACVVFSFTRTRE